MAGTIQERRQTERANMFWEGTLSALSRNLSLKQLIEVLDAQEWSYAFLLAVNPRDNSPTLLHVGPDCAKALQLPDEAARQLPPRYLNVFQAGCAEATQTGRAVRREGQHRLGDGTRELYRVIFIPVELREATPGAIAFGTFNCKRTEAESSC